MPFNLYLTYFKEEVEYRLRHIYDGFQQLKKKAFPDAIIPQAAIYLTVQINLAGRTTGNGQGAGKPGGRYRLYPERSQTRTRSFWHFWCR